MFGHDPIFGRERDPPKIWAGFQEFKADLGFAPGSRTHAGHAADLLFLCAAVGQPKLLTFCHFARQEDERSVQIHEKRLRFLLEGGLFWTAFGANRYAQGYDHPLTAPTARFGLHLKWNTYCHDSLCYGSRQEQAIGLKVKSFNE